MRKFFKEFKEFITRGNVLDMAVGIIIGSAFTAIITALVGNILTPLINCIPGSDGTSALQLVLRDPVVDEATGAVLKEAVVLDFGAVISAVVTFLITAFVLFIIVKTINSVRAGGKKLRDEAMGKAEYKQLRRDLKAQGMTRAQIEAEIDKAIAEKAAAAKAEQERKEAEEKANKPETLLKEIRDLLARSAGDDAVAAKLSSQDDAQN